MSKGKAKVKNLSRPEIKRYGYEIASKFDGNLTIRQLYYQFIRLALMLPDPNDPKDGQRKYKQVVKAIAEARLEGDFPLDWVEDRIRSAGDSDQFINNVDPDAAIEKVRERIHDMPQLVVRRSIWYRQPKYVIVGVEKDALSGLFEPECRRFGAGLFVFRGYASISALYQLAINLEQAATHPWVKEAVMLYFGDHDPDGFEIPRSARRNLERIAEVEGMELPPLRWKRVALSMEQIEQLEAPPMGAKMSSSRYAGYVKEHGTDDAWELDAIPPDALPTLVRDSINAEFDWEIYHETRTPVRESRAIVKSTMCDPEWMAGVLESMEDEEE